MPFDFDAIIDRRSTNSLKWCIYAEDILPLWVADMDFCAPEVVTQALRERVEHGIFGYTVPPPELRGVIAERLNRLYNWPVEADDIVLIPGVVSGLNVACRAFCAPGDRVLVETPVYPPLLNAPANWGLQTAVVPLQQGPERYERDLNAFEQAIDERTRLFLLCNPHNPVGRVFEQGELEQLAEVCLRHNVVICSDEIHLDFIFPGHRHIPIASLSPEVAALTVTLIAPSKSFNIPGLGLSLAVIQNPEVRATFKRATTGIVGEINTFGYTAALAAYQCGQEWLDELMVYLQVNRDYVVDRVAGLPGVRCHRPEGTYLAWLDCREAGIPGNPKAFFMEKAHVALNDGPTFGTGSEGFVRLNYGCPRATLEEAFHRMQEALGKL